MKRKLLMTLCIVSLLGVGACNRPDPDPDPTPVNPENPENPDKPDTPDTPSTEIDINNATPGGFSDDGLSPWDE